MAAAELGLEGWVEFSQTELEGKNIPETGYSVHKDIENGRVKGMDFGVRKSWV